MIEARAAADLRSLEGIYRLSGQTSQIKALRLGFDAGAAPALGPATANIHSVGSLLKVSCRHVRLLYSGPSCQKSGVPQPRKSIKFV